MSPAYEMIVIDNATDLEPLINSWEQLIASAIEPNPFFDPDFLIPAIRHMAEDGVYVLVVRATNVQTPDGQNAIYGLMPIRKSKTQNKRSSAVEIWMHDHCFDATPLIRQEHAVETISFILEWLSNDLGVSNLCIGSVSQSSKFADAWQTAIGSGSDIVAESTSFSMPCFKPLNDAVSYISNKVAPEVQANAQNLYRKLCERGEVVTSVSSQCDEGWVEPFLRLESSNWSNEQQADIAAKHAFGCFFREMAQRMLAKQKMTMLKTTLTGQPIAMSCEIQHRASGSKTEQRFQFKLATNRSLQALNPGLILELENLQRLHSSDIECAVSFVDPALSMINEVWSDRAIFQSVVVYFDVGKPDSRRQSKQVLRRIGRYFRKK